ncbi:MAG: hypothetical protein M1820_005595 [Bogoriella megaspora]|nr:MAG: hypothetical protein M1820_005595 [Bogoriella megaspora]
MLLSPRTFKLAQIPDRGSNRPILAFFEDSSSWHETQKALYQARKMLLIHQSGSVKVGEVVRYTITYTPSTDRILPTPKHLHVKIKNTSAIPLRAAFLHGPYTLHVSACPSIFDPNSVLEDPEQHGIPEFEPNLKAGANWQAKLTVPDVIRESGSEPHRPSSSESETGVVTWIVEIASQILFSNSASVDFELLIGRDERSLDLGFAAVAGYGQAAPGKVQDHQEGTGHSRHPAQTKGVYSKAIKLKVEDTTTLWNKPALPKWEGRDYSNLVEPPPDHSEPASPSKKRSQKREGPTPKAKGKQKRFHIVILTHGLHSNVSGDMLYLKESIDAAARKAREDTKARRRAEKRNSQQSGDRNTPLLTRAGDDEISTEQSHEESSNEHSDSEDEEDEEVLVRGFTGNVTKTERGIQYLGKRLAKHILTMTYPDQPCLPTKKKSMSRSLTNTFSAGPSKDSTSGPASHVGSSIHKSDRHLDPLPYKFTSISFVGHSLGGIVQTYAIGYIQKHSPQFFELIKPVNFIAMASPMLGLSNENPMYVKFSLDFGLVGRTGQDLGLTWRPTTATRSGWSAMSGVFGSSNQNKQKQDDPGSKPLLRILPTGPAHHVLRRFRNRTLYSNVVNDGIVPLRTSCLLFLDWRGLDKAEKARRENGLIGTMATWGWREITGENTSSPNPSKPALSSESDNWDSEDNDALGHHRDSSAVPQPSEGATADNEAQSTSEPSPRQFLSEQQSAQRQTQEDMSSAKTEDSNPFSSIWSFLRPSQKNPNSPKSPKPPKAKTQRVYNRSQTLGPSEASSSSSVPLPNSAESSPPLNANGDANLQRPPATRGDSVVDPKNSQASPPPKTSFFEAAGDILNPPIPPTSWLIDPSKRPRTIFHDRVYHPEDIPPPPPRKTKTLSFSSSADSTLSSGSIATLDGNGTGADGQQLGGSSGMRVEEKIARAYHRDLSWRKVLVRLEPDAHNNMIVRRKFGNAYGWPVIKHLCDTHFADTYAATTRDEAEPAADRARGRGEYPSDEVKGQEDKHSPSRDASEMRERRDELGDLQPPTTFDAIISNSHSSHFTPKSLRREDSAAAEAWDDAYFEGSDSSDDASSDGRTAFQRFLAQPTGKREPRRHSVQPSGNRSSPESKKSPLSALKNNEPAAASESNVTTPVKPKLETESPPVEGHRGLGVMTSPTSPKRPGSKGSKKSEPRSPAGTSEVGLRKSVEEQIDAGSRPAQTRPRARSGSFGVAEQVARMGFREGEES